MNKNTTQLSTIEMQAQIGTSVAEIWCACTDAKHLVNWWAPFGADMQVSELAPETGGVFHYSYLDGQHQQRWRRVYYTNVVDNATLSLELTVSDEHGHVIPLPLPGGLPQYLSATITLQPVDTGTLMTVTATGPAGIATNIDSLPEEMAAMIERLKQYLETGTINKHAGIASVTGTQLF
jgi:uncharacterized protein YndB with AHSA1/START domain